MVKRAWTHWATSQDLHSLRAPGYDAGTGLDGRPLGSCARGRDFVFDPFDAYNASLVTNPNVIISGSIGSGKSTVTKMMLDRALERGRKVVVVDPKGEYSELGKKYGVKAISLGADGWCNPFSNDEAETKELLRAILASAQGSSLSAELHYVIDETYLALIHPRPQRVFFSMFCLVEKYLSATTQSAYRSLALLLHRFVFGDLAGLFDGSLPPLIFEGQLVILDLSKQWSANSLSVAALSAVAAAQQIVATQGEFGYLVIDEAWALLADEHALRWLQGSWKLARSRGLSHVLVLHRWSDVATAGDQGTAQRERALGLLRECEAAFLFRQPPDEAKEMGIALNLHGNEERVLVELSKGTMIARYGRHRSIVKVRPDSRDNAFIDTDKAMREISSTIW
jgi:energy-coupling factor transporter ATP-binding protein EcfA2